MSKHARFLVLSVAVIGAVSVAIVAFVLFGVPFTSSPGADGRAGRNQIPSTERSPELRSGNDLTYFGLLDYVRPQQGKRVTKEDFVRRYEAIRRKYGSVQSPGPYEFDRSVRKPFQILSIEDGQLRVTFADNGRIFSVRDLVVSATIGNSPYAPLRQIELQDSQRANLVRLAEKVLVDKLGFVCGRNVSVASVVFERSRGRLVLRVGWRMLYHGYIHYCDGFVVNVDLTDKSHPRMILFGNFGSKTPPPRPDIRVREADCVRRAFDAVTAYREAELGKDIDIYRAVEPGETRRQYVYRNDRFEKDGWNLIEESHFVYVIVLAVVPKGTDPQQAPRTEETEAWEVWVDCASGKVVGGVGGPMDRSKTYSFRKRTE